MKVTTDACLFGAWVARELHTETTPGSRLLDIGAGTGLLSLLVAQKTEGLIDAIEMDPEAAAQAAENVSRSPWPYRIRLVRNDLLQWQPMAAYDFIFANPPFYENELKSGRAAKNIAHHDEGLKLTALLSFVYEHLTEKGSFFLLLPAKREAELAGLFQQNGLWIEEQIRVKQTPRHAPFRSMIRGRSGGGAGFREHSLTIKDETDAYTPAFALLLSDYYLYL